MDTMQRFWQYLTECLRLLYWAFFKPFTFNHWLQQEVHPRLTFTTNPFLYQPEFAENPKLRRYAGQVVWINIVTLVIITVLVAILYNTLVVSESCLCAIVPKNVSNCSGSVVLNKCITITDKRARNTSSKEHHCNPYLPESYDRGLICEIHDRELFQWDIILFLVAWISGILLATIVPEKILGLPKYLEYLFDRVPLRLTLRQLAFIVAFIVVFNVVEEAFPMITIIGMRGITAILNMAMVGMIASLLNSVAGGVAGGMIGVAGGMLIGVFYGGVWVDVVDGVWVGVLVGGVGGVLGSVWVGLTGSVVGVMLGVMFSVAGGMEGGVALTISWLLGQFRLYFWPFEALWMCGLRFLYPPQQADQALRWLPPRFDEMIYLPLPFMTQLVTEAHRVNSLAARHTLDHLLNFTNQQTVAGHITLQIALDTLQSCQTEYEIAHLATDKLNWIPEPPPASLGTSLPKCLDISHDVCSAYEATTAYRHKEFLAKPLKDLTQLRQQLAYEQNLWVRTTLGQITQRWQNILETAQRTLTEQIQHSGELPAGAYIAGSALDPEVADQNFRGRQDLFAEIENLKLATQPPILLLYGGRRTGKTSALKYLPKRTGPDLVPLLVDLQGIAEANTLLGVAEGMAKRMTDFARTTRNMTLPAYDPDAFRQDPFFALRNWFQQIEKTIPNKRFLLCLDEFERLEEIVTTTQSRAPLNFIRATFQHYPRWIVLFSGSHHPQELAKYWSDYLINTRTLRLSYLQDAEARDLIEHPSADFPAQVYDPLTIDAIIHHTRCQPYLVQLLCQNVIELLNRDQRRYAQPQDVTAAIPQALERGQQYFNEMWQHTLKDTTHRVIIQKVLAGQTLTEEGIQQVPYLIDKEILEATDTGYRFQVPMVEGFLRQCH